MTLDREELVKLLKAEIAKLDPYLLSGGSNVSHSSNEGDFAWEQGIEEGLLRTIKIAKSI